MIHRDVLVSPVARLPPLNQNNTEDSDTMEPMFMADDYNSSAPSTVEKIRPVQLVPSPVVQAQAGMMPLAHAGMPQQMYHGWPQQQLFPMNGWLQQPTQMNGWNHHYNQSSVLPFSGTGVPFQQTAPCFGPQGTWTSGNSTGGRVSGQLCCAAFTQYKFVTVGSMGGKSGRPPHDKDCPTKSKSKPNNQI